MANVEQDRAWVTLLTKPSYLPGTVVLDYSLKTVGSKYPLIVMVSHDVPNECRDVLTIRGIQIVEVNKLAPKVAIPTMKDERFKECWSKLKAFWLYQFKRVVLLDSDMLVRRNMDELLEIPLADDWIAATHVCACNPRKIAHYPTDWIPENCAYSHPVNPPPMDESSPRPYGLLNGGLVVGNPSEKIFSDIENCLNNDPRVETFQFSEQDLLATYFKGRWQSLPYYYNALKTLRVIHKNLWKDEDIRCLHYILAEKPWMYRPNKDSPTHSEYYELDVWWWDAFERMAKEIQSMATDESRKAWQYLQSQCGN